MSQIEVEHYNNDIEVVFHGYQYVWYGLLYDTEKYWCLDCFEREFNFIEVDTNTEHLYLSRIYIKLTQFTDRHQQSRSSYCNKCKVPLYDIAEETCQHLSPTSSKWLQRFRQKRHYGLRGGGTSQSTKQWNWRNKSLPLWTYSTTRT